MTTASRISWARSLSGRSAVATWPLLWATILIGCSSARPPPREFRIPPEAQSLDLTPDTPLDPELQEALQRIDRLICRELGIAPSDRAFGIVDLGGPRVAMINADQMFYGASVPKIMIVFAYLLAHPDIAASPPPMVMRELQAVIKRSDNDLAAKYSQLVGLEPIQRLLLSPEYRFYDQTHGGGLWCGKHYGIDRPRTGDPLGDLSHAATVRQCLRFYLRLEQDRLGSPIVCRALREVFAAPWAEFHDDYFVAGLRGLGLKMLRKNGLYEDWHLDTARIELPDRPILLAGMIHHPRGPEYLSRMARSVVLWLRDAGEPESACLAAAQPDPTPWRSYRHRTIRQEAAEDFGGEVERPGRRVESKVGLLLDGEAGRETVYESPPIFSDIKFNELLVSWNVRLPPESSFRVDIRVGRRFDGIWSPWLHLGSSGPLRPSENATTHCDQGRIDVDYFSSSERFDLLRYRLRCMTTRAEPDPIAVRRVVLCVSDLTGLPDSWTPPDPSPAVSAPNQVQRRLTVPFKGQATPRQELSGRLCSPASVSMVMAYHGIDRSTLEVAEACYDPVHDLYGNWPRNVQAAYTFGVPGYLTRFSGWAEVERCIAEGCPVIISIRFNEPGLIAAAPYATTDGHLIVVCGFDAEGNVEVNDPAAHDPGQGQLKYARPELERAWLGGSGGVAYVLLPREADPWKQGLRETESDCGRRQLAD